MAKQTDLRKKLKFFDERPGYNFFDPENQIDEGSLTDQELSDRLAGFEELGQTKGDIDPASIARELESAFQSRGDKTAKQNSQVVANFVANNGRMPSREEMQQIINPTNAPGLLANIAADEGLYGQLSGLIDSQVNAPKTAEDIKRIKGLQGDRALGAQRNAETGDFLGALPGQLEASRNEYLSGETDRTAAAFEDFSPQAMAQLNARGLLFSGSPEDVLTEKATNLAGGLDDLQSQLEQEDNQFYFNAAYQNALKTELATRDDYRGALDTERNRIMTDRANRFQATQGNYDRQLNEELNRSDLQRSFESTQSRLKREQEASKRAGRGQLFSQIGSAAGGIAGAAFGGPVGAVVGQQAGSGLGEVGGKIG